MGNDGRDVTLDGRVFRALAVVNTLKCQGRTSEAQALMARIQKMQREIKLSPKTVENLKGRWLYRVYAADNSLLYIGITDRGREREREHARTKSWWSEVHHVTVEPVETRAMLRHLEAQAIRRQRPKYNIQHNR